MESVTLDVEGGHLRVGDLDTLGVDARIEFAPYCQAGPCRCGGDQFNHRLSAGQRLASPGLGDVAEQPVLTLVPLRGAGRVMANPQRKAGFVGKLLKFDLEQPHARPVGAAAVRRDHQLVHFRVPLTAHQIQPEPDRIDRELRRVVVDTEAHAASVGRDGVNARRDNFTKLFINEVVHVDLIRATFRPIVAAAILVVTNQSFFFVSIEITG